MFQVKFTILATVAILAAVCANDLDGLTAEQLIVQGQTAKRGQFPFYVFLQMKLPEGFGSCGGSLISNQWIVTAGHCLNGAEFVSVSLGSLRVRDVREPGRKMFEVTKDSLYLHPQYSQLFVKNDIGLIKLPAPVKFNDVIKPINLGCSSTSGMDVVAIGNGITRDTNHTIPDILQYTYLETTTMLRCHWEFPFLLFRKSVICAKGEEKRSVCQGDSGGPLATADNKALIGVSSFVNRKGCETGKPQGFTRISSNLEWIKEVTGIECKN